MHDTPPRLHLVGGSSDHDPMDLGTLGDAVVLVVEGEPRWSNPRFDDLSPALREACIKWHVDGVTRRRALITLLPVPKVKLWKIHHQTDAHTKLLV